MFFERSDEERIKKLGIISVLDLALHVPQKYEDFTLDKPLFDGDFCAVACEVLGKQRTPKTLQYDIIATSHDNKHLKAVFFSPKRYQQNIFSIGDKPYLYGKISLYPTPSIIHAIRIQGMAG